MTAPDLRSLAELLKAAAQAATAAAERTEAYDPARLLNYREAGALLRVHASTVSRLVTAGALPCVSLGDNAKRVRRADLVAFIERRRTLPRRIGAVARAAGIGA